MPSTLKEIYSGVKKNSEDRNENDLYPTPPIATYILQKYINLPKNIIEPCAGRGNISIELIRNGFNVRSFDMYDYPDKLCQIHTGQDVLSLPKQKEYDALITNPPFFQDLPRKIAEKGVNEYDVTALFVRLTFLEGKKRNKLFTKNTPSNIIFFSDRVRFNDKIIEPIEKSDQIGGMIAYCWIVFKKNHIGSTDLRWVLLEEEYDEWRKKYDLISK